MNRRSVFYLTAALPLVATLAWAEGPGGWRGPMRHGSPGEHLEKALKDLNLEPARMEKVKGILDAAKAQREAGHARMRDAFEEMHKLLEQDSPSEAAVMQQADKMGAMQLEEHKAMLRTLLAVRAELTPEQRAKLKEMRGHMGPRSWRREHGKGPGPSADPDTPDAD